MGSEGGRRADAPLRRARQFMLPGVFRLGLLLESIDTARGARKACRSRAFHA